MQSYIVEISQISCDNSGEIDTCTKLLNFIHSYNRYRYQ